jgi:hypothetical protein
MTQWWRLWSGHVFLALTIGVLAVAGWALREAMRAISPRDAGWYLVVTLTTLLASAGLGVITAWRFRTHRERYYIRKAYKPTGGDD